MLGVAMVTGVAFTAVLEHHLNSVNPGVSLLLMQKKFHFDIRSGGPGHLLCTVGD